MHLQPIAVEILTTTVPNNSRGTADTSDRRFVGFQQGCLHRHHNIHGHKSQYVLLCRRWNGHGSRIFISQGNYGRVFTGQG